MIASHLGTARLVAELEDSSPDMLRARLKAVVRQITIQSDGRVLVEGTYEPLVAERLASAEKPEDKTADAVRRLLVLGART